MFTRKQRQHTPRRFQVIDELCFQHIGQASKDTDN